MYSVYVLRSEKNGCFYVGFTTNVKRRVLEHNQNIGGEYTKGKGKWCLVYTEAYLNKNDALAREKFLKSGSGLSFLKKQLKNFLLDEK
jgi:putative endonuclease